MKVLNRLQFEPYGYSHGDKIGFRLTGIEAGYKINFELLDQLLVKRKGSSKYNTTRTEAEVYKLLSGFHNQTTNGEPIWIEIEQENFRSSDYQFGLVRPGHADLSAYQKYGQDWNYSGGGQFSGRLTVLHVIAGEIARQVLSTLTSLEVIGHVSQVGHILSNTYDIDLIKAAMEAPFSMVNNKSQAIEYLQQLKAQGDSIGGKLNILIVDIERNYGDDFFASLESKIAFMMFSIPAIKAIEFGIGTNFAIKKGSEVVEHLSVVDGQVASTTNYNGGINGGIANCVAPVNFTLTFKPTSSIFHEIDTVKFNGHNFEPARLEMTGRHDSFIANRGLWPVIGLVNLLLLELEMEERC